MELKKTIKATLLGIFIFSLCSLSVNAGFGVSPTNINSEYLKPGASFTQEFTLSRSDATADMNIEIVPDLGNIDSWFTFDPGKTFVFKRGQTTQKFKVIVKVPSDAQYTDYKGVIRVNALPSEQAVGGVSITQGVRLDAGLTVTEQDIRSLSILSIKALDSQEGKPIRIEVVGQNIGNVDASPTLKITVMDMLMNIVEEHEVANFGFVSPNETKTLIAEIESKLPTGEYFINVQVLLDGKVLREERLVFNIVNIPAQDKEDDEVKTGFQIGSIFTDFKDNMIYVLVSLLVILTVYLLLEKLWKNNDKNSEKQWAILLGSKKLSRIIISTLFGVIVLLLTVLSPVLKYITFESLNIDTTRLLADLKSSMLYILFSIVVFIGSYLLLEKIWRNKKYKTIKPKFWAIILGSKKYSRFILSFFLAVLALFGSAFVPIITLQPVNVTQGAKIFEKVQTVFTTFNDYLPYIIFSIMAMIVSYLLIEKCWRKSNKIKKGSKPKKSTFLQIILGRDKFSRVALSLVIGVVVFSLTVSYTVLTFKTEETDDTQQDVQGAQDIQNPNPLNVVPEEQTYRYVVYEEDDINSKVIYVAQEGETFNVLQETDEWYTVELSDSRIGWLPKQMVKSTTSEER